MFSQRWCYQLAFGALCFNVLLSQAWALNVEYCSSLNTASTAKNISIYQSNGLCHDFCLDNYAFAIVQNNGCWCSDYAPGTSTTGCDNQCPGYPSDLCGGDNLYGYIALTIAPLGTEGASSAAAPTSSSSSSTSTSTSPAAQVTVTATPEAVTVVVTPTPSTPESSTGSSSSSSSSSDSSTTPITTSSKPSSSSSSTWTPTPVTSLETVTGQVRTVTVTPTTPPNAGSAVGITKGNKSKSGLSTGAAVGLTIGLVALVAIISTIIFFCVKKHHQEKANEFNNMSRRGSSAGLGSAGGLGPSRTMSQSSRFVLNTDGRQVVETWEPGDNSPGLRSSRLMPVDPRLDPFAAVYQRGENKSRESINTIRDDHDYSRRVAGPGPILRATNPDHPED